MTNNFFLQVVLDCITILTFFGTERQLGILKEAGFEPSEDSEAMIVTKFGDIFEIQGASTFNQLYEIVKHDLESGRGGDRFEIKNVETYRIHKGVEQMLNEIKRYAIVMYEQAYPFDGPKTEKLDYRMTFDPRPVIFKKGLQGMSPDYYNDK